MKAKIYSLSKTLVDVKSGFQKDLILPRGTVVECYENPEGYAVNLAIPDASLVGGFNYENVILFSEQFEVVDSN